MLPREEDGKLDVFVVSDRPQPVAAQLKLSVMDFNGQTLSNHQQSIEVEALKSKSYMTMPLTTLLEGQDRKAVVVFVELTSGGRALSTNSYFFEPFKNLTLPRPQLDVQVVAQRGGFKLKVSTDKFARAVYLSSPYPGMFVDNYLDVIPGRPVEIEFRAIKSVPLDQFRQQPEDPKPHRCFLKPSSLPKRAVGKGASGHDSQLSRRAQLGRGQADRSVQLWMSSTSAPPPNSHDPQCRGNRRSGGALVVANQS